MQYRKVSNNERVEKFKNEKVYESALERFESVKILIARLTVYA